MVLATLYNPSNMKNLPCGEPYINQRTSDYSERFTFTGKGPRKGWRTPLSKVKYREQRDEEKERSRGPFASERGDEPRSGIPYCSVYSYTYFGARYMDHELMTMWLSVDPMADKYPSISPYAYCAWNPVKLVDPDGRNIWEIDRKGNVTWKAQSDKTTIYAVNKQGKRTGASVDLSNDDILNQLKDYGVKCQRPDAQGTPIKTGRLQAAVSTNKEDVVKFFKFTSESTDQEWGIYAFHKGNASKYGIITYQYDDQTPSKSDFATINVFEDVDNWSVSTMIHCHPNPRSTDEEVSSLYGDRRVAPTASYKSYYTYMSRSENLYIIDKKGGYTSLGRYQGYQSLMNIFK